MAGITPIDDSGSALIAGGFVSVGSLAGALWVASPAAIAGQFASVGSLAGNLIGGAGVGGRFASVGLMAGGLTLYALLTGQFASVGLMSLPLARQAARINAACVVQTAGLPGFALVGRTDANRVSLVDLLTPGGLVRGMRYVTRPMITNLPYHMRATMGEQEPRAARKRVPRVKVYGEGVLAAGSTITLHVDGKSETYACQGQDVNAGILIMQGFTPAMIGRVFWVELNLNGWSVIVRDHELDYVFVG